MEFGRKRIILDDKLLKQEVLNKNKKLIKNNSSLSKSIEDKKRELKDISKDIDEANKTKQAISNEVILSESVIESLKDTIVKLSNDKLEANIGLKKSQSEIDNSEVILSKAEGELVKIEKTITALEAKKLTLSNLGSEISKAKQDLKKLDKENLAVKKAIADMDKENDTERKSKELHFMKLKKGLSKDIETLNNEVLKLSDEKSFLQAEAEAFKVSSNTKTKTMQAHIDKLTDQFAELDTEMRRKINDEGSRIKALEDVTNSKTRQLEGLQLEHNKAKESLEYARKRYSDWKLTALDEVARLRNKGKLENIDKAGLADVLNN